MHLWMDAASLLHLEKIINKAIQQLLLQRIKNRHKVSQGRIVSWSENSRMPSSPGSDSEFSPSAALKPSRS